ncbi:MAG: acyl-CoA thioester hydrolase [Saprospiraceae bacterium]|jgi:acyl-CoA thioester hydrolase
MKEILVKHTQKLRVRYSETDQMGIVYYGNYAQYFEVARVEFLRALGFVYKELEDDGVIMPVVRYETDFKSPAKYDEELSIVTSVKTLPTSKITFDYEVFSPEGTLVCTAKVILVFLNKKSFRTQRAPEKLVELLANSSEL